MLMISDYTYESAGKATPGQEVTVVNADDVAHTVTARDEAAGFDVNVPAGSSVTFAVPEQAGRYSYYCKYHSNMSGTLVVG